MKFTIYPPDGRKELPLPVGEYRPTGNEINMSCHDSFATL
jgi:hypothetical protein